MTAALVDHVRARPWVAAWTALGIVTTIIVVSDAFGVFAPDTKPELYTNPGLLLHRSLYVWQPDPHLGQMNYNTGILPVAALLTVVRAIGVDAWLAQRLFMVALLLVGAAGTGMLVVELTGRRGLGPWLAGVVHAWHPWTVVGANSLPVRLPHAVLPWVLVATIRAVRSGSWRDAALAGLAYGAMAGINGGVVNLLYVVPVLLVVVWAVVVRESSARAAVSTLGRIGVVAVGISLYWIVPSVLATGSSAGDVLLTTEDPVGLARLSSPSEVLRGMGMWTNYVVIDGQIENVQQLAFLTNPVVVVAGFLLTAAGLVAVLGAPRRVQVLVGGLTTVGLSVLVGLNTSGGGSPAGRALRWLFEVVPATTAFRTTNKAGSFLVLGLALALGAGIGASRRTPVVALPRRAAALGLVALVAVATGPGLTGGLHPNEYPVPDHWYEAAAATDVPAADRLLLVPGNAQVRYAWGYRGVDDLDAALWRDRHVTWRSTIPAGSAPASNLLTAFGTALELGRLAPGSLATHTRLLGAGTALVRGDTDWRRNFGRSTALLRDEVLEADGVTEVATHGPTAGELGIGPALAPPDLPVVTEVDLPNTTVEQAWTLAAPLLVIGDAMAVDQLVRLGIDPSERPLLYVDDLDEAQLATALAAGGEVVLSDTNHRRSWTIGSLTDGHTPLLSAFDGVDAAAQRARSTEPAHQTVRLDEGPAVTASGDPYWLLRRRAAGQPALANDGDLSTGWQYGAATDSRGGWLQLTADLPGRVERVSVVVGTGGKLIERLRIEVGDTVRNVAVDDGLAVLDVNEVTDRIRIEITDTSGDPLVPATVNEVVVLGDADVWGPTRIGARLPTTLEQRVAGVPALVDEFASAPLRIVLSRLAGDPDDPFDDEEATLRRTLAVPFDTTLDPSALVATVRRPLPWPAGECSTIATVTTSDGTVHDVRARATRPATDGGPVGAVGCGAALDLPAGTHRVDNAPLVTLDHLALGTVAVGEQASQRLPVSADARGAIDDDPTRDVLTLEAPAATATLVSSGQAWHPGWRASADGVDLGPPVVAGGYAAGWFVPAGTQEVDVRFAPQGPTRLAQVLSSLVAIGSLVLLGATRRRGARS